MANYANSKIVWCLFSKLLGEFLHQEELCSTDLAREELRAQSAKQALRNNKVVSWTRLGTETPLFQPGDVVTLKGTHFGAGVDIDFSKIMIGNNRILETDLRMFDQKLATADQVNYETDEQVDGWPKNIIAWSDKEIIFRVPDHVSTGPLIVQVQKRIGANESLKNPGEAHNVIDAQTSRIMDDTFIHNCAVVSKLSDAAASTPIAVDIDNPGFSELVRRGARSH